MKRFAFAFMILLAGAAVFAQSDLQVLAVVKLNKNESVTVKQLKTRVEAYQKQKGSPLSVEDKKKVLDAVIQERLVIQAAQKAGVTVPDSMVEQTFLQSISQQIGKNVTEQEFEQIVREQTKMSLDDFMRQQTGMSVSEYKAYLKSQLIAQNYIVSQRQNELKSVAPSDDEIRAFYELNKASFVWTDMLKMFLVIVPKGGAPESARVKAADLLDKFNGKKLTTSQITVESKKENSNFQAGEILVNKNQISAQQLGISYQDLISLFGNNTGFVSKLAEQETSFQFYTILRKYDAKMLSLSDVVRPETTVTVYDYIKQTLEQQKTMEYLSTAAQEIAKSLDTEANVDRKKKGAELDKLLDW